MHNRPALPFRLLQRGLARASRAGAAWVDRVLRPDAPTLPLLQRPLNDPTNPPTLADARGEVEVWLGEARLSARRGATLLEVAELGDIDLRHYCGGNSSCGTCRVEVREGARNLSPIEGMEAMVLGPQHVEAGSRLACQACVRGPVKVQIPEWF